MTSRWAQRLPPCGGRQRRTRLAAPGATALLGCLLSVPALRSLTAFVPRAGPPGAVSRGVRHAQLAGASRAAGEGGQGREAEASPLAQLDAFVDGRLEGLKGLVDSDAGRKAAELLGEERFESVKTSALGIVFAVLPEAVTGWLDPDRLTPRWEFQLDMLALDVLLFSLVYRYAVREGDDNPMQKMGVLSAFVLPRALFLVEMPAECTPAPLSCGPPLGYFSWSMLLQVAKQLAIGGVTLGASLYGLERAFASGLIRRFRGGQAAPPAPPVDPAQEGFRFPW